MRVLIGTPVHECKDYSMERWIENVSRLQYPADLLLVDNSPGREYLEKLHGYCKKYGLCPTHNEQDVMCGVKNYKLVHLDFEAGAVQEERLAESREIVRREILSGGYDAWFSWECDQIIPADALSKLIELAKTGNCLLVSHNSWVREAPGETNASFGCTLIDRKCLQKFGFLRQYGRCDPENPGIWYSGDVWFRKRIARDGDRILGVAGVINPIYHLNK